MNRSTAPLTSNYEQDTVPGPVALVLTRQALPVLDPKQFSVSAGVAKGAYVLVDEPELDLVLVATESTNSRGLRWKMKGSVLGSGWSTRGAALHSALEYPFVRFCQK